MTVCLSLKIKTHTPEKKPSLSIKSPYLNPAQIQGAVSSVLFPEHVGSMKKTQIDNYQPGFCVRTLFPSLSTINSSSSSGIGHNSCFPFTKLPCL